MQNRRQRTPAAFDYQVVGSVIERVCTARRGWFAANRDLEIEDLVQECFTQFLRKRHLFNPQRGKLETFVAVVAISQLKNLAKSRARGWTRWHKVAACMAMVGELEGGNAEKFQAVEA